jgi:maleylacetate reductase
VTRLIRFGVGSLAEVRSLATTLGVRRLLAVATSRGAPTAASTAPEALFDGVLPHVPVGTVREAAALARASEADGIVAVGGGSAIDTAKALVVELLPTGHLPVIAVPTTYAGAEWTPYFGLLLEPGRKSGGVDVRARPQAAVYDPALTLSLPVAATVGTAMNALAHCAEAFYHPATTDEAVRLAADGAAAISDALPRVVADPAALPGRSELLRGAMQAALALDGSGLCLGHAMAQGLGGRYGLPQGTMNALCLASAVRFNAAAAPEAVSALGQALGSEPARRVDELAALGGFGRLRDYGVPEGDLASVAEEIAARPGARANPRVATAGDVVALLRSIW